MSLSVGPSKSKHNFIHSSFIKDYLNPAPSGRWNLSLEDSQSFIETNYDWIKESFENKNYKNTEAKINDRGAETF